MITNIIGLYEPDLMESQKYSREIVKDVARKRNDGLDGLESKFEIKAGPLKRDLRKLILFLGGADRFKFIPYVLEVHYSESEENHRQRLRNSCGAMLYYSYANTAREIAKDICKEENWEFKELINSWPIFQSIVFKEYPKFLKPLMYFYSLLSGKGSDKS